MKLLDGTPGVTRDGADLIQEFFGIEGSGVGRGEEHTSGIQHGKDRAN